MQANNLRMTEEDAQRVAMLKQQIANNLQTQFIAGGDNQALKDRCGELSAEILEIESRYEPKRTAWHEGAKAKKQADANIMKGFNQTSQNFLSRKL